MIKEAYCSFEVAKLLKEKGFNEPVTGLNKLLFKEGEKPILKITHQKAMRWLREVHKVLIVIDAYHADHWEGYIDSFEIRIYSHGSTIIVPNEIAYHTNYEEAVEAALKYCLVIGK